MTRKVYTATEDTPVTELARLMSRRRINRVPIVDAAGKLIGIVTRADLVKSMAGGKEHKPQPFVATVLPKPAISPVSSPAKREPFSPVLQISTAAPYIPASQADLLLISGNNDQ